METIEWGIYEQVSEKEQYQLSASREVPSFMDRVRSEGSLTVRVDDFDDVQLAGICTTTLSPTPLIYASCLRLPLSIFNGHEDSHLIIRVLHDPFMKIYDKELFAPDAAYLPHGLRQSEITDKSRSTFNVRVSRSSYKNFKPYNMDYLLHRDNLRGELDARGWLSLNDQLELLFWKDNQVCAGADPIYVSHILEQNYKRDLCDELGAEVCEDARGLLYGPAAIAAQENVLRKKARDGN